jgi:hypothetical protein
VRWPQRSIGRDLPYAIGTDNAHRL